jgi:ATP-dependent DNA ligase
VRRRPLLDARPMMISVPGMLPSSITTMQPTLVVPFHRPGWVYEEKVDGWRMLALKDRGCVRLVSRQGVDHTARFADLAVAMTRLPAPTITSTARSRCSTRS